MRDGLRRAALANAEVPFVGIEMVVAAVDQRGRRAVLELQERDAASLGRPRRIEHARLRAHAPHQPAAEQPHGVDLVRHLIEQDAAALRRCRALPGGAGDRGSSCS